MSHYEPPPMPRVIALRRTSIPRTSDMHDQPARWWPLVAMFVLFVTFISGCKQPVPDWGEPTIEKAATTAESEPASQPSDSGAGEAARR